MDLGNGWQEFYYWSITLTPLALVQLCPHHLQYTVKCITWHCVIFISRIYTNSPYLGLHFRQKPQAMPALSQRNSNFPSSSHSHIPWPTPLIETFHPIRGQASFLNPEIRPTSWKQDRNFLPNQKSSQDPEPQRTLGHNRKHTQSQNSIPKLRQQIHAVPEAIQTIRSVASHSGKDFLLN